MISDQPRNSIDRTTSSMSSSSSTNLLIWVVHNNKTTKYTKKIGRLKQLTQIYCCFWSLFVTVRLKRIKKFGLVNNVVVVEFKREDGKQN